MSLEESLGKQQQQLPLERELVIKEVERGATYFSSYIPSETFEFCPVFSYVLFFFKYT